MGYKSENVLKDGASQAVAAEQTDQVVSGSFRISAGDSVNFLAKITVASQTVAAGITAKLQESWNGGTTWEDVGNRAQVSLTGASGSFEISLVHTDTSDAAQLPLWPLGRIVVTTGAGDSTTVTHVWISRRL